MNVQQTILDEIGSRLASITESNGYSATVLKIERARLKPFKAGDLPFINYWPVQDAITERQYGKESHELSITIELHDRTRDEPFTDIAFDRAADIVTALARATDAPAVSDAKDLSLGGLITQFEFGNTLPIIGEGQTPFCGVIVEVIARYTTETANRFDIVTI
jgi:hypothetical protein